MVKNTFPKLVQCDTGAEYSLSGRIVIIGSDKACHIRPADKSLPPRAAHLLFTKGAYRIQALSSEVTVSIDGKPLQNQQQLTHGSMVTIGESGFQYLETEDAAELQPVTPDQSGNELFLDELIPIVVSLLKNREDNVFNDLVFSVSRLLRSDASRLVQEDPLSGERKTISRYPSETGLDRFSNRAIDWAKEKSQAALLHDVDWKDTEQSLNSLEKNLVSSVLCAPLQSEGTTFGYLYLDRLQNNDLFTEKDRQLCDMLIPLFSEILKNHIAYERQRETIERLQNEWIKPQGGMIFESRKMQETIQLAIKFAKTESPILILGETGTGKELIARFVHEQSQRTEKPFKAINCGAIPVNLIESELFGHEKGAFTGATNRKIGLFEAAEGGTLLLDEIGELPLQLQVKLLRVLQEAEIIRVGGNESIPINVRIVAATNKNLEKEIEEGRFRQDIYFRLNVLAIELPPLRDRDQDILLLAEYFVHKYCEQFGILRKRLTADARSTLLRHIWPGNIRELENVIQKACLLSEEKRIEEKDIMLPKATLQDTTAASAQKPATIKEVRAEAERKIIKLTLEKTGGNVSQTAKLLDIDRKWLIKKMEDLQVSADEFRR